MLFIISLTNVQKYRQKKPFILAQGRQAGIDSNFRVLSMSLKTDFQIF
jgi:hypothetical protein